MNNQGNKALPLLLLILIFSVDAQITVTTAPPPTGSALLTINDSPNDQKLIAAKRL